MEQLINIAHACRMVYVSSDVFKMMGRRISFEPANE